MIDLIPVSGRDQDPVGAARFDAWADVYAAATAAVMGPVNDAWSATELRAMEGGDQAPRRRVAAVEDGRVVGGGDVRLPHLEDTDVAEIYLAVLPAEQGRGIGSALFAWGDAVAADAGRTTLTTGTAYPDGVVDPAAAFLERHGYAVAQRHLRSDLALPARPLVAAPAWEGDGYTILTAVDEIPDAWLAGRAELGAAMSTDVPQGDLVRDEQVWDADRIRGEVERARAMDRRFIEAVARHDASGRLVAFTHVECPSGEAGETAFQHDTLVVAAHRGHRLGLRIKAAATSIAEREWPSARRIRTWNAVENTPMLAVNRDLGYAVTGHLTDWVKRRA